jgi:transcription elongation factor Elf1
MGNETPEYVFKLIGEICCELCNEVIHNHFDCPSCGEKYASSDCYDYFDYKPGEQVGCESCGAVFEYVRDYEVWKLVMTKRSA